MASAASQTTTPPSPPPTPPPPPAWPQEALDPDAIWEEVAAAFDDPDDGFELVDMACDAFPCIVTVRQKESSSMAAWMHLRSVTSRSLQPSPSSTLFRPSGTYAIFPVYDAPIPAGAQAYTRDRIRQIGDDLP